MFFFGEDTSLAVEYYIDRTRGYGPPYARGPISEMSEKDAEEAYVHTRMAYRLAQEEEAPQEVLDALAEAILESFKTVATFSDALVKSVEEGRFLPVAFKASKFKEIIKEVRHPSSAADV